MCPFLGVSRAAYYAWRKRQQEEDPDGERIEWIRKAFRASRHTYGYRRIRFWMRDQGKPINGKAVLRIMQKIGLRPVCRRRRVAQQIESSYRYDNILRRDFTASRPNEKWVTDVTYIRTDQGWAYLAVIKDLFDSFIVAHRLGKQNSLGLVTRMVEEAKEKEQIRAGVILHSDQGFQFCSPRYRYLLKEYQMIPSMSRRGNCWDNAPAENFFSHLKEEEVRHWKNPTFQQASIWIDDYIRFYNYERIQGKKGRTPYQLRCPS
jgi:transposase InsO family protein